MVGGKSYIVTRMAATRYFCPVEVVRETKTLWVVKTPKGRQLKFRKKGMGEVGSSSTHLVFGDLPEPSEAMKLSAEAQS